MNNNDNVNNNLSEAELLTDRLDRGLVPREGVRVQQHHRRAPNAWSRV